MFHRPFVPQGILLACLIAVFAFSMKLLERESAAAPVEIPAIVTSDYLLFAHLNVKEIRESALFTEVIEAFGKVGGKAEWDKVVDSLNKESRLGISVTDLDSVTFCFTEDQDENGPISAIFIFTSDRPINREGAFGMKPGAKPDANGFYKYADMLVHFPKEKSMVMLNPKLAQKYLDGYAKNPTGWPFTPALSKAASGQTFFAALRPDKLPLEAMKEPRLRDYAPLLAARGVTVTGKLEGKELRIAGRASFADATAAGKASHKVQASIALVADGVDTLLNDTKSMSQLPASLPALKEAERSLAASRVEVVGSDVIASGSYSVNFKIEPMVAGVVKYMREVFPRNEALNNLKQVILAEHNYQSAYNCLLIHGMGAKGAALTKANEKPLLSWRVGLLPFLEEVKLYQQFKLDEPWDSENNKKLIEKMPKIYAPIGKPGKPGYTHLQMVIGPGAMRPGVFNIGTVPDGTSNTIAVVEAADPVIWSKPDDVMFPAREFPKNFRKKFGGQFPGGFHVAMWDGSVRFVPDSVSDKTLGLAICPDDGMPLGEDWFVK